MFCSTNVIYIKYYSCTYWATLSFCMRFSASGQGVIFVLNDCPIGQFRKIIFHNLLMHTNCNMLKFDNILIQNILCDSLNAYLIVCCDHFHFKYFRDQHKMLPKFYQIQDNRFYCMYYRIMTNTFPNG